MQLTNLPSTAILKNPLWIFIMRYRHYFSAIFMLLLLTLAIIACRHLLREVNPSALKEAIHQVSIWTFLSALLATALSFCALFGYEWCASLYVNATLPPKVLAKGSFCAFGIGNAIGLSLLSGGAVRYRLYAPYGLNPTDITLMTFFSTLALGLSLPLLAAFAILLDLNNASNALGLSSTTLALIAVFSVFVFLCLGYFCYLKRIISSEISENSENSNNIYIKLGAYSFKIPSVRIVIIQFMITTLDVIASASVLYIFLPAGISFGVFLLVYFIALTVGMLSHIPGGIGVFEAILLAAFAHQLGASPLAAALVLYRLCYVVIPLILACFILLLSEIKNLFKAHPKSVQNIRQVSTDLAPSILAILVFISGIVLLFSGMTQALDQRLEYLSFLVPEAMIESSHFLASLVGLLCLLLANGLKKRVLGAWMLSVALLFSGAVLSLLKGFDWEEAILLVFVAGLLIIFKAAFYRRSRLLDLNIFSGYLIACIGVLIIALGLFLFSYQSIDYQNISWWQFDLNASAPRSLRALSGTFILLAFLILNWLLRVAPLKISPPNQAQLDQASNIYQHSNQADGGLALTGDKAFLFNPQGDTFIMYARQGRSLVTLFDPIGKEIAALIWQFKDFCEHHQLRPVFYQVSAKNLPLYIDAGLTMLKLGEEALINLPEFNLDGAGMKGLRYAYKHALAEGLSLHIYDKNTAPYAELQIISESWLGLKNVAEKGFSLGRFDNDYLQHFRIAVICQAGKIIAFANILETQTLDNISFDLMRSHPDAPKSCMEFLMIALVLHFKSQGYQTFSLGMVPLSGLQIRRGAPLMQRLGALVYYKGEYLYNFQGLRKFKEKFKPHWEPRYMAVPAGINPLIALADSAVLIAGGISGIIKRN